MKKHILLSSLLALAISPAVAEDFSPTVIKNLYFLQISPSGKWIGSMAGGAQLYNRETGEIVDYSDCFLGLGNMVTDDGVAVGNRADLGIIMKDGYSITPPTLRNAWFCDIHAITNDGRRLTGIINNSESWPLLVPFYCDIDEEGNVGEPQILPYPKKDFFNMTPQYVTAVWISQDGKTIMGEVQDDYGAYEYPILYQENEDGEWSYILPSEPLFNPNNMELPVNPWQSEPPFPEVTDFMSPDSRELFEEQHDMALMGQAEYPDPLDFMTAEELAAYYEAADIYNEWYYGNEKNMQTYRKAYLEIVESSVSFSANDMSMHPNGDFLVIRGGSGNEEAYKSAIYKFYKDGTMEILSVPVGSLYPIQVLEDNTIVATVPRTGVPVTYLMLQGKGEFIPIEEYFEINYPMMTGWMNEFIPNGSGIVTMNSDMTVFAGGLTPFQLAEYDWENANYYFSSYFFDGLDNSGVEAVNIETKDNVYEVYNMQGLKVKTAYTKEELQTLPKGLYIINGKKHAITH